MNQALIQELEHVETREELLQTVPKLKRHFTALAELMIASYEYQESHPLEEPAEFSLYTQQVSGKLLHQLNRVYRIEGAREIIEKCQSEALHNLKRSHIEE